MPHHNVAYLPDDLLLELVISVEGEDELNRPLVHLVNQFLLLRLTQPHLCARLVEECTEGVRECR